MKYTLNQQKSVGGIAKYVGMNGKPKFELEHGGPIAPNVQIE